MENLWESFSSQSLCGMEPAPGGGSSGSTRGWASLLQGTGGLALVREGHGAMGLARLIAPEGREERVNPAPGPRSCRRCCHAPQLTACRLPLPPRCPSEL